MVNKKNSKKFQINKLVIFHFFICAQFRFCEHLFGLFPSPIGSQIERYYNQANAPIGQENQRQLLKVTPILDSLINHCEFNQRPHMEHMNQHKLIGLPEERVGHAALYQTIANA